MLIPDFKRYLLEKEHHEIKKESRPLTITLTVMQVIAALGLAAVILGYIRNQLLSYKEPDYIAIFICMGCCIILFTTATLTKMFREKTLYSEIRMAEQLSDEEAYIKGDYLVLRNNTGEISFNISGICRLESKDGKTSFTYNDPARGIIKFSCMDYYSPQIAEMLHDRGVR